MTSDQDQFITSVSVMRFLMGLLFALSLFLVELGVSQILLSKEAHCRDITESGRLGPNPDDECLSEGVHYFLLALSRGPFASAHSEVSPTMAWIITGVVYGLLGGIIITLTRKFAVGIYLGIHAIGLIILTLIAYLSNFIA
jgi:hypothetical protein